MATEIKDIKTSIMGTIEFNLKCSGHRGFQEFLFYPADTRSNKIKIQSDNRIGFRLKLNQALRGTSENTGNYAVTICNQCAAEAR